jgi:5-hydroxyisourate hydrolase-like protein (transthyretin family)
MRINKLFFIFALFMVLLCCFSSVSASEDVTDDTVAISHDTAMDEVVSVVDLGDKSIAIENDESLESVVDSGNESFAVQDVKLAGDVKDTTLTVNNINHELISTDLSEDNSILSQSSDEIEVETWEDIRYYSSLTDKNYILKLKANTNYYPNDASSSDCQIIFKNNVTIIGAQGAYIGDDSPDARNITYTAMIVPDNSGIGITLKNITFKWIGTRYQPDGVFCQMGGNTFNYIENCYFTNISTNIGHSSILYIKLGDAVVTNCTFVNCTTDFGCLSVYNPDDDPTKTCTRARMQVYGSYFEGNYARTEPGCINNCGVLTVTNSTFYRNSAFWWAGAIHTHGGANTTLYDCNFTDNVAGWNGGALYTYSYLQIYNTIFVGNNCTTNNGGGAIGACKYLHAPYIYIEDSLFKDNANNCWGLDDLSTSGTGRGGAISIMDQGSLEVRNTTFLNNSASMGTAICAINGGLQMGSPDIILVGNRFINHTRVGDVLDIRLATSSYFEISDNYYCNNSFEFKKLRLISDEMIGGEVVIHIDAELKNPDSFENDILDTTPYDIYVDGVYNKTVIGKTFSVTVEKGETCNVYAIPVISNSRTNEIEVGTPKEYIYVSQQSGKDTNDGLNRATPVKTMAKAIELAREKGNIIMMDGIYSESNLTIDYNLSIAGENNVKFSGNVPMKVQSIFTVTNYADLSLTGITFDNLVFTANTTYKNKKVILQDSGYLTIDNCTFNSISPSGNTAMVLIEASNVEVYNSKFTNNNKAGVYVTLIRSNEFLIDNCTFTNNIASYSSADSLIRTVDVKTGVKGTVSNSIFENNKVKAGCIYFGANSGVPLTVTNTKFIANTVGSSSDHSSCIKIETAPTLRVEGCLFKDNINYGTRAAVIYSSAGSGSIYVSQSIIVNNSYSNNNNVVFSASTANNLKSYKNLNNNWWGNTLENYTVAPSVYASACDNWLVLNMTSNATKLAYDQKALVSINLYYAVDRNGESYYVDTSDLPDFDLDVTAQNGTLSSSKITVKKGSAEVEYTFQSEDAGSVTVSYADIQSNIAFNSLGTSFLTADRFDNGLKIKVGNHVLLNATLTDFDTGEAISGATIVFLLNNTEYTNVTDAQGKAHLDLSGIDIGKYIVNYRFDGNEDYDKYNLTVNDNLIVSINPDESDITESSVISVKNAVVGENGTVIIQFIGDDGPVEGTATVLFNDTEYTVDVTNGLASVDAGDEFEVGVYDIYYEFLGGPKYGPTYERIKDDNKFAVEKANVTISYTNERNVITFNVSHSIMPTGTINVTLGDVNKILTLSDGVASYNFGLDIAVKGNYALNVIYDGDENHNQATLDGTFKITKSSTVLIEDVPEEITTKIGGEYNPQFNFNVTCGGELLTTGSLSFDFAESGLRINSAGYRNGAWYARFSTSDANLGEFEITLNYDGDGYYKPASTTFKMIIIPTVASNVKLSDDKVTVDVKISGDAQENSKTFDEYVPLSDADGSFTVTFNDEIIATGTISNGVGSVSFDRLDPNNYEFIIIYSGNDKYPASTGSASLKIPRTSQWASVGGDAQNSGNSIATREDGVSIIWNAGLSGDLISSAVIDSFGNIYVTDGEYIYSFTNNGTLIWSTPIESWSGGPGSSGIALYGDEAITSPQSGNEMFIFNATDGTRFGGNYAKASSAFVPIVGPDGRVYTPTEFGYPADGQGYNGNYWVSVLSESGNEWTPYQFNQFLVEITGVAYESPGMKASPSFDKEGYIYANTVKGFKIVDIATGATVFNDANINGVGRPVIDSSNIAYILDANINGIYAISTEGIIWYTTVTGGIGSTLAVDNENGFLYTVNSKGTLYKYDTADFEEIEVYSLNSAGVSIILDAESNVYVSTDNGDVVALSADGELLWTINLGSKVTGQLAMDNNGVIYAVGDETLYALGYDSRLSVKVKNYKVVDDVTIYVSIAETATGNVTISLNNKDYTVAIENGTANLNVGKLPQGNYKVKVSYGGSGGYAPAAVNAKFAVKKISTVLTAEDVVVVYGDAAGKLIAELKDAAGNPIGGAKVKITVGDLTKSMNTYATGKAYINTKSLAPGDYVASVTFAGDDTYASASAATNVVVKIGTVLTAEDVVVVYQDADGRLVAELKDTDGNPIGGVKVKFKIGDLTKSMNTYASGKAYINTKSLAPGDYVASVSFAGNDYYASASAAANVAVRVGTVLAAEDVVVVYGDAAGKFIVELRDAAGNPIGGAKVKITVGDLTKSMNTYASGKAYINTKSLAPGDYVASVSFAGDDTYASASAAANVAVRVGTVLTAEDVVVVYQDADGRLVAELKDADGNPIGGVKIKFKIGDLTKSMNTYASGKAYINTKSLDIGNYVASVTFAGNDYYASASATAKVTVTNNKISTVLAAEDVVVVYGDESGRLIVELKDADGNPIGGAKVKITVGDLTKSMKTYASGKAYISTKSLALGDYVATVSYDGDDTYAPSTTTANVAVKKGTVLTAEDVVATYGDSSKLIAELKDTDGNPISGVKVKFTLGNLTKSMNTLSNGKAYINTKTLAPGKYTAVISCAGNEDYAPSSITANVSIKKAN